MVLENVQGQNQQRVKGGKHEGVDQIARSCLKPVLKGRINHRFLASRMLRLIIPKFSKDFAKGEISALVAKLRDKVVELVVNEVKSNTASDAKRWTLQMYPPVIQRRRKKDRLLKREIVLRS